MLTIATSLLLAAATGISTNQVRTAAPSAVNLSSVAAAEGSSLAICRADHTHSLSGTLPQTLGGTGAGALTCTNQFLTSNGTADSCVTDTLAGAQHANQGTTTTVLHGNAAGNPAWSAVTLTTDVSGVLPVVNGGTNSSTALSNNRLIVSASGKIAEEAAGTDGQVQTQVAGVPTWSNTIGGNTTISGTLTVSTALAAGLTQEAWIAFPYAANWSDYAGNMAGGYFKDSVGVVHLRGFTKYALTTGGSGITVGTLPAGYRPNAAIHFATTNFNGTAFVAPMTISVNSAGVVTVDGFVNGGVANTSGVGLDGVTFDTR